MTYNMCGKGCDFQTTSTSLHIFRFIKKRYINYIIYMAKQENIKAEGLITRDLSNGIFEIELLNPDGESTGHMARGTIGSRLRMNNVRLCVQDRVVLELSPYDLSLGRIIYRYNVGPNGEIIKKAAVVNNNRDGKGKKKKR